MVLSKNFNDSIALRIETIEMMSSSFVTKEACRIIIVVFQIVFKNFIAIFFQNLKTKILSEELLK